MKNFLPLAMIALMCVGCDSPKAPLQGPSIDEKLSPRSPSVEATSPVTTPPKPEPEPTPSIAPIEPAAQKSPSGNEARGKFEIVKPGAPGWSKSQLELSKLGAKVDSAIMGTKGAFGEGRYDIKTSEMSGYQAIKTILKDPTHYRIEFVNPAKPSAGNYIIRDGARAGFMDMNSWSNKDFPVPPTDFKLQLHMVAGFGMSPYVTKKPYWAPLLSSLATKGFKVTQETQNLKMPSGESRPFYRVLGTGKDITAEFLIDGKRFLPVTVRVNQQISPKKSIFSQWSPGWSFNRPIPAGTFSLPDNVN